MSSVTEYAGFVDANALSFIWPEEFSGIRICIVSGRLNSPILSIFHQDSISPSSAQFKDVYIRCDGSHFTLLRPFSNDGVSILKIYNNNKKYKICSFCGAVLHGSDRLGGRSEWSGGAKTRNR